jgi:hypothetical protein
VKILVVILSSARDKLSHLLSIRFDILTRMDVRGRWTPGRISRGDRETQTVKLCSFLKLSVVEAVLGMV